MAIIRCPECNNEVSTSAEKCPHCGVRISGNIKICPDCGAVSLKDEVVCKSCGASLQNTCVVGHVEDPLPDKHNKHTALYWVVGIVAVVVVMAAVGVYLYVDNANNARNEQEAYENVVAANDTALCSEYLEHYPKGLHFEEVTRLKAKLVTEINDWNDACISGTRDAFIRFLSTYPDSNFGPACCNKIDSLDFVTAVAANTVEAYQYYLHNHSNGLYVNQALQAQENLDELVLKPEEEQQIKDLCVTFFANFGTPNDEALVNTTADVMNDFLNKKNATHDDIKILSKKIYENSRARGTFVVDNDFNIHKAYDDAKQVCYYALFSVTRKAAEDKPADRYSVSVCVNDSMKIQSLGMKRHTAVKTQEETVLPGE